MSQLDTRPIGDQGVAENISDQSPRKNEEKTKQKTTTKKKKKNPKRWFDSVLQPLYDLIDVERNVK